MNRPATEDLASGASAGNDSGIRDGVPHAPAGAPESTENVGADTSPPADDAVEGTVQLIVRLANFIRRPELVERFRDASTRGAVLAELGLPKGAEAALSVLVDRSRNRAGREDSDDEDDITEPEVMSDESAKSITATQLEAFVHIRRSFQVAIWMSILMFAIGAIMLLAAFFRALSEKDVSTSTLTIGGLALADFAILFFRQPWKDVATNLINSQRARTLATSYLVGLSLLHRNQVDLLRHLADLTDRSVTMLQDKETERSRDYPGPARPSGDPARQQTEAK